MNVSSDRKGNISSDRGTSAQTEEHQLRQRNISSDRGTSAQTEEHQNEGECDAADTVSFVARPWRMVDGKLNRLVCKGMLEGLLHHIMSAPGVTLEGLLLHYRAVLQPQATLELLQVLTDLGCVKRKTLPAPLLQPSPAPQPQPSPAPLSTHTEAEQPDSVYYEPTVSCVLRLSQVLPHERHWSSETL
ncbi:hypothetical protein WMY93_006019 [Mugilogobius chulae]|uniref:Uncharacterized protein n=1 Tax=Mugilogobius chulae TaxID=88201 RepID=A0AAW0PLQ3_9GOBI